MPLFQGKGRQKVNTEWNTACLLRQMGRIFCINRGATIYFFINEGGRGTRISRFARNDKGGNGGQ
jgi:hypothetical protein